MNTLLIDNELLKHLSEIDNLLVELDDMEEVRRQDQETQLRNFIKEGVIHPLSEREGLFLITKKQMDNFNQSLKGFNERIDSMSLQLNSLKGEGVLLAKDNQKSNLQINMLQKDKLSLERIISEFKNDSSLMEGEEESQTIEKLRSHIKEEEMKTQIINERVNQLTEEKDILSTRISDQDRVIAQLQSYQQKSRDEEMRDQLGEKEGESQRIIVMQRERIELLEGQINFLRKQVEDFLQGIDKRVENRMDEMRRTMKGNDLIFSEESGSIEMEYSSSRTLWVCSLQRRIFELEDQKDTILREFNEYKQEKERELLEANTCKLEVEEYKKLLDTRMRAIQEATEKMIEEDNRSMQELAEQQQEITRLRNYNERLQIEIQEHMNKIGVMKTDFDNRQLWLEKELGLKNSIIRNYDVNSDPYQEQERKIIQQVKEITQMKTDSQNKQFEWNKQKAEMTETIEKLRDENKILLIMCENRAAEQMIEVETKLRETIMKSPDTKDYKLFVNQPQINRLSNALFEELCEFYKKKYQNVQLNYDILRAECSNLESENRRLAEENRRGKQQLRHLQLVQKQSLKQKKGQGLLFTKEYEPLSQNIQRVLDTNQQQSALINQLQLKLSGQAQQIEQLKLLQESHTSPTNSNYQEINGDFKQDPEPSPYPQNGEGGGEEEEELIDPEEYQLNQQLHMIQTVVNSGLLYKF